MKELNEKTEAIISYHFDKVNGNHKDGEMVKHYTSIQHVCLGVRTERDPDTYIKIFLYEEEIESIYKQIQKIKKKSVIKEYSNLPF